MSQYRRAKTLGGSHFFTVITCLAAVVDSSRKPKNITRGYPASALKQYPFIVDAWVLLPDHTHCVWTLPSGDSDYSKRWSLIKSGFSKRAGDLFKREDWMNKSKIKHRESTIWQRRFWEHSIRNQEDFNRHIDYIYWNPVKHGYVTRVTDWQYSTFHRDVKAGLYPESWGGSDISTFEPTDFGE